MGEDTGETIIFLSKTVQVAGQCALNDALSNEEGTEFENHTLLAVRDGSLLSMIFAG